MIAKPVAPSSDDTDMDMLPPWATGVILAFALAVGPALHSLEKKPVKLVQTKPCQMLISSMKCE
jgi:hypothetical protein